MARFSFLRGIVILSIIAVVMLPLYAVFFIYPSFNKLLAENTEKEAVRIATHMSSMLIPGNAQIKQDSLPDNFSRSIKHMIEEFSLVKVKVLSSKGEIVYSTDAREIGEINRKDYFREVVAKGNPYTKIVRKNTNSLEDRVVAADVVETYVPIIRGNNFIGAFEIYFDVTDRKEKLDNLVMQSSLTLFTIALGLLLTVVVSAAKAKKTISERKKAGEALRDREATLRTITAAAKDAIVMMDDNGRISFWNPAAEKIFGYTCDEAMGKELHLLLGPKQYHEAYREWLSKFREKGEGPGIGKVIELKAVRKDGSEFPVELALEAIQIKGRWCSTGIIRDITERKRIDGELKKHQEELEGLIKERTTELTGTNEHLKKEIIDRQRAEEELRKSEKFFSTIFDSIRDPFSIIGRDFRIVKANEAYAQMRNKDIKELVGRKCYEELQKRDNICDSCVVEKTFKSGDPCAKEKLLTFPEGLNVWVEIYTYPLFDDRGAVSHVVEYTRDITDRKKAEEERKKLIDRLEYLSRTDSLTGLLNRRALIDSLEYEVDRAKRYSAELSLIICDMDSFKEINDTYGHVAGDRVLQGISQAILDCLRGTDISGRYGGDEFMVVLPETTLEGAKNLAERIRASVEGGEIAVAEAKNIRISMSFGVTRFNAAMENLDSLVKRVDSALYEAKRAGGNRVHITEV